MVTVNSRVLRYLIAHIAVMSVAFCAPMVAAASDGDSTALSGPISDGPYLYRHNDSTIIALYLCEDSLVVDTTYSVGHEFRVPGFCYDAGREYVVPSAGFPIRPHTYSGVPRVFAISDIHGEYEYMVEILRNGGVVDSTLHWTWGDGHLVIVGDIFDRGDMVTECLWLLYRLEQEAAREGGEVHVLLGNHEQMVINGDDRYIHDKYLKGIAAKARVNHRDLYGPNMVLGQWLRSKHTVITINDVLYVHGGLSPLMVDSGLTAAMINDAVRRFLGINSVQYRFDETARLIYGSLGPLWYRGYWEASEGRYGLATDSVIDRVLDFYGMSSIAVGHTNQDSLMVHRAGRVFGVDVLYEDLGSLQALLWQDGHFYRVEGDGTRELLR